MTTIRRPGHNSNRDSLMTSRASTSLRLIVVAGVGTVALLFLRYLSARGGYDYSDAYAPPASATTSDHRSDDHPLGEIDDDEHEATTTTTTTTTESDVVSVTSGSLTTLTGLLREEDDGEAPPYEAEEVPWYHCGPAYGRAPTSDRPSSSVVEVLLLHGASFTHEHWRESGILEALCRADPALSVTAADLRTVGAARPAAQLVGLARALSDAEGLTTGAPLVVVSPSASGKDVVALAALDDDDDDASSLRTVVRAWVPVASPAVKTTSETVLKRFANANVPVLALHGTTDSMGAKVSAKLRTFADAEVSTFEGGHAGYFQQQQDFVDQLVTFLHKLS